jgi:hypothetical protein
MFGGEIVIRTKLHPGAGNSFFNEIDLCWILGWRIAAYEQKVFDNPQTGGKLLYGMGKARFVYRQPEFGQQEMLNCEIHLGITLVYTQVTWRIPDDFCDYLDWTAVDFRLKARAEASISNRLILEDLSNIDVRAGQVK